MINNERLLQTFLEIVKIDSPTGHEEKLREYIVRRMQEKNIQTYVDGFGNVMITISGKGEPVFLNAHLDTVEPGRGIVPVVKNGRITGSGTTILGADDKVAVAVLLEIIDVLHAGSRFGNSLEVVFTVSEEVGNLGAVNLEYNKLRSKHGYCFDSANRIGTIITAAPFYNRFDLTLYGKSAHASHPAEAINALDILSLSLSKIKLGQLDKQTIANIGVIKGGQVRNTIPGELELQGEVRSFSDSRLEKHTEHILEIFEEMAHGKGGNVKTETIRENSGYKLDVRNTTLQEATVALRKLGISVEYKITWGCADANIFRDHGLDIVNLGDGVEHAHTTQETIKISDLCLLAQLVFELVRIT